MELAEELHSLLKLFFREKIMKSTFKFTTILMLLTVFVFTAWGRTIVVFMVNRSLVPPYKTGADTLSSAGIS